MRRIRTAIGAAAAAAAAITGVGVAAVPAQATVMPPAPPNVTYCQQSGATYICQYGMATAVLANGTKENFVVGTDFAVWTDLQNPDGSWSGWSSMGGVVYSKVNIAHAFFDDENQVVISAKGSDGNQWARARTDNGEWTPWVPVCDLYNAPVCE
jgi:hypothetical protein